MIIEAFCKYCGYPNTSGGTCSNWNCTNRYGYKPPQGDLTLAEVQRIPGAYVPREQLEWWKKRCAAWKLKARNYRKLYLRIYQNNINVGKGYGNAMQQCDEARRIARQQYQRAEAEEKSRKEWVQVANREGHRADILEAGRDALATQLKAAEAERNELRRVLEQVEWVYRYWSNLESGDYYCLWCLRQQTDGHAPDCELQKALGLA